MLRFRPRGFTLIEAMIVVTIVAILAVLATVAYRRWVHTAYLSEAHEMVNNIRAAQESFRAENGGYLNISSGLGPSYDFPHAPPGKFKYDWNVSTCSGCAAGRNWTMLNIQPSAPLAFGYSVVADNANPSSGFNLPLNGQSGGLAMANGMSAPWYLIEADGDLDGNLVYTHVYGLSATNQIFVDNEGE